MSRALRQRLFSAVVIPLISVACGFVVAGVVVLATGSDPIAAFTALFQGAFTNPRAFPETLVAMVPYVFLGLAVALGFRAGLFNIGAEGQFYLGAIFGVLAGNHMLGGFIWAAVPGLLKARFGAHEVITTIMLNYVAFQLTDYLINKGPMSDPKSSAPRTPFIDPLAHLPVLVEGTRLHLGLILALLAIPVIWFLLERTTVGFRIRTVGFSQGAARAAGISVAWTLVLTMGISGALAGLAGADEILGVSHYMPASFSIGYGFDSIAVALLARSNPWAILPSAFLFGAMRNGAAFMQLETQVSSDLISIVQAIVIMFVAAPIMIRWIFRLRDTPADGLQITQRETAGISSKP